MTAEARKGAYTTELELRYPGFTASVQEARPMLWPNEPWTQAGYCFPAPGQVTTVARKLYEGIGRLHFAGEHTSMSFAGYMNGGLESGRRVARQILEKSKAAEVPVPATA
jgi:monoamine oxidase